MIVGGRIPAGRDIFSQKTTKNTPRRTVVAVPQGVLIGLLTAT